MVHKSQVCGVKLSPRSAETLCESCVVSIMQLKSVDHRQSNKKLELVHSDVCGPFQADSIGGSRCFVTFIDDYTCCVSEVQKVPRV